mmetsp:Transcript_28836/g.46073  ORF Transcript_28836/g.46073 Transcript_28836/m.46073 type:complete len:219 (+) Transcript_28836:275-931(+)
MGVQRGQSFEGWLTRDLGHLLGLESQQQPLQSHVGMGVRMPWSPTLYHSIVYHQVVAALVCILEESVCPRVILLNCQTVNAVTSVLPQPRTPTTASAKNFHKIHNMNKIHKIHNIHNIHSTTTTTTANASRRSNPWRCLKRFLTSTRTPTPSFCSKFMLNGVANASSCCPSTTRSAKYSPRSCFSDGTQKRKRTTCQRFWGFVVFRRLWCFGRAREWT